MSAPHPGPAIRPRVTAPGGSAMLANLRGHGAIAVVTAVDLPQHAGVFPPQDGFLRLMARQGGELVGSPPSLSEG
jgi:hypothetical protein